MSVLVQAVACKVHHQINADNSPISRSLLPRSGMFRVYMLPARVGSTLMTENCLALCFGVMLTLHEPISNYRTRSQTLDAGRGNASASVPE